MTASRAPTIQEDIDHLRKQMRIELPATGKI